MNNIDKRFNCYQNTLSYKMDVISTSYLFV
jgi:hypothetical protein